MGISPDEFAERFPLLWHMAEDGTWPAIRKYGLLSTSSLLDLYGVQGARRKRIETQRRPGYVELTTPSLPGAVIRDQAPISDLALARVLMNDLTPSDWYRILNSRVFFWVSEDRLDGLLKARLYRDRAHTVLVVDTAELLRRHGPSVTLSPINSGNTMMNARPRGLETFQPLDTYPFHERRRASLTPVVELGLRGVCRTSRPSWSGWSVDYRGGRCRQSAANLANLRPACTCAHHAPVRREQLVLDGMPRRERRSRRTLSREGSDSPLNLVRQFHEAMRLPIRDEPTRHISEEEQQLRLRLINEEVGELTEAMSREDLVDIADALADLVYVTYGTAIHYGLDLDAAVAEVHKSNMSKAPSRGSVMRGDGKVLKNPKFRAPDLRTALGLDDDED